MANLSEVCATVKNYFLKDIITGTFIINSGTSPLDSLIDGQYFRIVGSVLNDGVYKNPDDLSLLENETFTGEIWTMAVPKSFEKLCDDIQAWRDENEKTDSLNMTPFNSESFGGYSYSKGSYSSNGKSSVTWQSQFSSRLNTYRRIEL